MTDVFISYSRNDRAFVKALHRGLAVCQRKTWVDWQNIPLTADWWTEICSGIEKADTFVFVISPHSLASAVCHLELAQAQQLNKRIIPILRQEIDFDETLVALAKLKPNDYTLSLLGNVELLALARDNWRELQRPNWPMLRRIDDFRVGFKHLIDAFELDLDHVREHTRLLVRANEWDKNDRKLSQLLRGDELERAEFWLSGSNRKEPKPTDLHVSFIVASRNIQIRRQRFFRIGSLVAVIILLFLTLTALWQANVARNALVISEARGTEVAYSAGTAISAQSTAERRADEAQSIAWSSQARQAWEEGNLSVAFALALEAGNIQSPPSEVIETIYQIAYSPSPRREVAPPFDVTEHIAFSPDGSLVLSRSSKGFTLWELNTGAEVQRFPSDDRLAIFNASGNSILTCCTSGLNLWDVTSGALHEITSESDFSGIGFSSDGNIAYSVSPDLTISLWDTNLGTITKQLSITGPCREQATSVFSHDGRLAMLQCRDANFSAGFHVILFDMLKEEEIYRISVPNPVSDMEFSADGSLAAIGWGLAVSIVDVERRDYLGYILPNGVPSSILFMPNSRLVLVAADPFLDLWDVETGQLVRRLGRLRVDHQNITTWDGRQMLYQDVAHNRTWLWDLYNGAEESRIRANDISGVKSIHFSADGEAIDIELEVGNDRHLCWNIDDGEPLADCSMPLYPLPQVSRPPAGCSGYERAVYSTNRNYAICINEDVDLFGTAPVQGDVLLVWDLQNAVQIRLLEPDSYWLQPIFSPDDSIFVTATFDISDAPPRDQAKLSFWNTNNGARFLDLGDQDGLKLLEAFTIGPNGRTLATASCNQIHFYDRCHSGDIIIWRIDTYDELIDWIHENRITYELTCDERLTYKVEPYCNSNNP
ncbi:MAG: hypothetical protein BroJett018_21240 [Chloroflexota bacterium]|nr:TIR domain-containing protein [Chloroflexota bacterium]NOG65417.1 TIR domain-containing protein [Chloroflexota bacterium]GIK64330.1 MAG: hypothetical protein BroJett018_21240 [Chloroflexota bacterium]